MYLIDKKVKLKQNYANYQVARTQEIDLVIHTNKCFPVENVKFDENKWTKDILPELRNFLKKIMSRSILCKAN